MTLTIRRAAIIFSVIALLAALLTLPNAATAQTFENCDEARAAGREDIPRDDPAYDESLDRDADGLACESGDDDGGQPAEEDDSERDEEGAAPDVETPTRIDTGGGYCALNDCG